MWSKAFSARLRKFHASVVLRSHQKRFIFDQWRSRHELKLVIVVALTVAGCGVFILPLLQKMTGSYFTGPENLATLRSLLSGTGAALIGAATIGFSLVVFAMQINVERMPHGLFRQLSSDRRLLFSFLGSFVLALLIAGSSLLLPDETWAMPMILTAVAGVAGIVLLFLYAYRRALKIINPIEQLSIMTGVSCVELQKWSRLADLAAILQRAEAMPEAQREGENRDAQLNQPRAMFFLANAGWDAPAREAINYAMSYTRRFTEQGDYEVTEHAFGKIVDINGAYCQAKQGTFIASNPFFDLSGTTDGFINHTLEHLRQAMQAALTAGDERLALCVLRTLAGLQRVYLHIDYPGGNSSKHHAMLAAGYLAAAVESVAGRELPDVMMEGVRLMGRGATATVDHADPVEIITIGQKIGTMAYTGALKASHQPVTRIAFEQLALVTFHLLCKGNHDLDYPLRELRLTVTSAAKRFLLTAELPLSGVHSSTLGPYFSVTQVSSLLGKLQHLANQILAAPEHDETAARIINNIETWADQLYVSQKELLVLSVEKRSHFTFDAITWIIEISNVLNALSNAPACSEAAAEKLRKHAGWLISTLSWVPEDSESLIFVEANSLTDSLFEAAQEGHARGCLDFYLDCQSLLVGWAKKCGKHESCRGIWENSIKALAAVAVTEATPEATERLRKQLSQLLDGKDAPSMPLRDWTARALRTTADELGQHRGGRGYERALHQQDRATVSALLEDIAAILMP